MTRTRPGYRQATFSLMVWALRTNKVMSLSLRDELRIDRGLSDAELAKLLCKEGIMNSATQIGNENEDDAKE